VDVMPFEPEAVLRGTMDSLLHFDGRKDPQAYIAGKRLKASAGDGEESFLEPYEVGEVVRCWHEQAGAGNEHPAYELWWLSRLVGRRGPTFGILYLQWPVRRRGCFLESTINECLVSSNHICFRSRCGMRLKSHRGIKCR
jgi:hypothetical protein